ncbi:unnamed protein product [Mycena citricolor]|uniref:Uncharacterized protein n=1 Tax=Mycena citricolor TaxID=2018698 RepID=A0AAD2H7Q7_9AGAR|nr:unnamed protein product [Mycena citricolor]
MPHPHPGRLGLGRALRSMVSFTAAPLDWDWDSVYRVGRIVQFVEQHATKGRLCRDDGSREDQVELAEMLLHDRWRVHTSQPGHRLRTRARSEAGESRLDIRTSFFAPVCLSNVAIPRIWIRGCISSTIWPLCYRRSPRRWTKCESTCMVSVAAVVLRREHE